MEERISTLSQLDLEDRVERLERRDLRLFSYVRRGVRAIYVAVGMLGLMVAQQAGLDLVSSFLAVVAP